MCGGRVNQSNSCWVRERDDKRAMENKCALTEQMDNTIDAQCQEAFPKREDRRGERKCAREQKEEKEKKTERRWEEQTSAQKGL